MPRVGRLKETRERRFLTQKELAAMAKVHEITIVRLEQGKGNAQFRTIRKLAEALGVKPEALVDGA